MVALDIKSAVTSILGTHILSKQGMTQKPEIRQPVETRQGNTSSCSIFVLQNDVKLYELSFFFFL
jgi:hypothetical protein